jgi:hypothetical protein
VTSSVLKDVGYDPAERRLEIGFHNGYVYHYFDVPPEVYRALMAAESHGNYFNLSVKPYYRYRRIR